MGHGDHNRSLFSLVCRDYCDSKSLIIYIILNKLVCVPRWFKDISNNDNALAFIASSGGKNVQELTGLADANFANITDEERKSISGLCFYVAGCPVSWRSKLQTITAGSTHEAELIAIALAANEGVWVRKLLLEIGFAVGLAPAF